MQVLICQCLLCSHMLLLLNLYPSFQDVCVLFIFVRTIYRQSPGLLRFATGGPGYSLFQCRLSH